MKDTRILFMGTPDFATAALKALVDAGENIVGVITKPDRQSGRGMKEQFSDVKKYALSVGLPVYQPTVLKDGAIADLLSELAPDVAVVAAYGKILPDYVLEYPKYGCINIHGSLLPKYRGAAPIQRAVINGEKYSGITVMQMDSGLDTGDMLLCEKAEIGENMTTGELYGVLASLGGRMIVTVMESLRNGTLSSKRTKQDDSLSTYAAKIEAADEVIDWNLSSHEIHNRIRGLFPFPTAKTTCGDKLYKLCTSRVCPDADVTVECENACCGEIIVASKGKITVKCGEGFLYLDSAKPEGSKQLSAADLINGRRLSVGDVFR